MHVSIASNATCSARLQLSHSHMSQPSKSSPRPRRGAQVARRWLARSAHLNPAHLAPVAHLGCSSPLPPRSRGSRGSPGLQAGWPAPRTPLLTWLTWLTWAGRVTWGFLYDLGGFPIRYVSYCILMYLAVYLDVSRSYTSQTSSYTSNRHVTGT